MKLVIFTAALMLGGTALAQEYPAATPAQTTTTTSTAITTETTSSTVAADNSAPKRDARGIPVISAPAMVPAGINQGTTVVPPGAVAVPANQAAAFQTQAAATDYPACSRTVTDHCVQTYERGRSR